MRTLSWMATAWLGLAGLQLVVGAGSGRVAGLLRSATTVIDHALSPEYPGIPNWKDKKP